MRSVIAVIGIVMAGVAGAHPLGAEQSLLAQLGHQLLGGHHLPLLLITVVAVVAASRLLRRKQ